LVAIFFANPANDNEPKTYLTFTFDDGYKSVYTEVLPIFMEYNISGTVYVITNFVGKEFEGRELMNWSEINELQKHGFEIGSHTANHKDLTLLSEKKVKKELKDSKETLWEKGINAVSLAIPYGKYNEDVKNLTKEYYRSVRSSVWGYNDLSNLDKYNLRSKWITNQTSISAVKSWIEEAAKEKKWLILMFHMVEEERSQYSISAEELEEIVKYAKSKDIEIKTVSELIGR